MRLPADRKIYGSAGEVEGVADLVEAVLEQVAVGVERHDWHRERGKTMRLQDRLTEAWETQAGADQRVEHRLVATAVAGGTGSRVA